MTPTPATSCPHVTHQRRPLRPPPLLVLPARQQRAVLHSVSVVQPKFSLSQRSPAAQGATRRPARPNARRAHPLGLRASLGRVLQADLQGAVGGREVVGRLVCDPARAHRAAQRHVAQQQQAHAHLAAAWLPDQAEAGGWPVALRQLLPTAAHASRCACRKAQPAMVTTPPPPPPPNPTAPYLGGRVGRAHGRLDCSMGQSVQRESF